MVLFGRWIGEAKKENTTNRNKTKQNTKPTKWLLVQRLGVCVWYFMCAAEQREINKRTHLFTILSTVDNESKSRIRAVVGWRIVEVPQTLGWLVINQAGLGLDVVDVA